MIELLEKIEDLKIELDKLDLFKELDIAKEKINSNEKLISKIKEYNNTYDKNLRMNIYSYDEIKNYKRLENEVNLLIISINNQLKRLQDKGSCPHENS